MTLIKSSGYPQLFYPSTAKKHGIHAALVQSTIMHIENTGNGPSTNLRDINDICSYLSKKEVKVAYKLLLDNGYIEEVD